MFASLSTSSQATSKLGFVHRRRVFECPSDLGTSWQVTLKLGSVHWCDVFEPRKLEPSNLEVHICAQVQLRPNDRGTSRQVTSKLRLVHRCGVFEQQHFRFDISCTVLSHGVSDLSTGVLLLSLGTLSKVTSKLRCVHAYDIE